MNALQKLITEIEGAHSFFDARNIKVPDAVAALKEIDARQAAIEADVAALKAKSPK